MELLIFCFSIAIIWINWKIYKVSKYLLDVSFDLLVETKKMNRLLGAEAEASFLDSISN